MSQGYTQLKILPLDTDATLSNNSDYVSPSQKAIKSYIGTEISIAITKIQGTNIYTGGTASFPTINVSALTINTLITSGNTSLQAASATTLSATSISSSTLSVTTSAGVTNAYVNNIGKFNIGTISLSANGTSNFRVGTGNGIDIGDANTTISAIWLNNSIINSTSFSFSSSGNGDTLTINSPTGNTIIFLNGSGSGHFVVAPNIFQFGSAGTNAINLSFPSTNGTKIGVSTTEKFAFWNSAPIIQPTSGTPLNTVLTNTGLMQSGATNVQLNLPVLISGDTTLKNIGNKLIIASGTNASIGLVTLVAGTATVNNTLVTNSSIIILTPQTLGTITRPTGLGITGRTAGVSFTIVSKSVTDTSVIGWNIIEPV